MLADKLPITGPCPIDLDAIGFDRTAKVSHCSHCVKSVTNLSNMTRDEARDFMRAHKGEKLCVSYACDQDGNLRFRPEPEPALVAVTRLRPRPAAAPQPVAELQSHRASRMAGFVATLGVSAALAACAPHGEPPRDTSTAAATTKTEPPKPVFDPQRDAVEVAGGVSIPEEIMVDGEMAVPDPDTIDEPCDKTKDQGKRPPKPDTTKVEPPKPDPIPTAGLAVIPPDAMVEGEMKVPDTLEEPTHARIQPRR